MSETRFTSAQISHLVDEDGTEARIFHVLNQAAVDRDTLDEMTAPRCDTAPFTGPVVGYEPETVWSLGCERGRGHTGPHRALTGSVHEVQWETT